MSDQSSFINVLRGPSAACTVPVTIRSKNNINPVELTTNVIFTGAMGCNEAAAQFAQALNASFLSSGIYYGDFPSGQPQFEVPYGFYSLMPRATVCAHVANVWAQAQFSLYIGEPEDNTTGLKIPTTMIVKSSSGPIYVTLDDFTDRKSVFGIKLKNLGGKEMSLTDEVMLMQIASNQIRAKMGGHFLIASQYMQEIMGRGQSGFNLDRFPVVSWDDPCFNGPLLYTLGRNLVNLRSLYTVISDIGSVSFDDFAIPPNVSIKMSYLAGLGDVDETIKDCVMLMTRIVQRPEQFLEMKGGSGQVKLQSPKDLRNEIADMIAGLFE